MKMVAALIGGGFMASAIAFGGALIVTTIVAAAGVESAAWIVGTFFLSGVWLFICSALFLGWLADFRKERSAPAVRLEQDRVEQLQAQQSVAIDVNPREADHDALLLERMKQRRLERELDRELDELLLEESRERERRGLQQRERRGLPPREDQHRLPPQEGRRRLPPPERYQ